MDVEEAKKEMQEQKALYDKYKAEVEKNKIGESRREEISLWYTSFMSGLILSASAIGLVATILGGGFVLPAVFGLVACLVGICGLGAHHKWDVKNPKDRKDSKVQYAGGIGVVLAGVVGLIASITAFTLAGPLFGALALMISLAALTLGARFIKSRSDQKKRADEDILKQNLIEKSGEGIEKIEELVRQKDEEVEQKSIEIDELKDEAGGLEAKLSEKKRKCKAYKQAWKKAEQERDVLRQPNP